MAIWEKVVLVLAAIGAINVGLVGALDFDLVGLLSVGWLITTVSVIVGLCGIWALVKVFK